MPIFLNALLIYDMLPLSYMSSDTVHLGKVVSTTVNIEPYFKYSSLTISDFPERLIFQI